MNCKCGTELKNPNDGYHSKLIKGQILCRRCSIEEFNKHPHLWGIKFKINTPVRFTDDYRILDVYGNCLIPDITFKTDIDHTDRQKWLGEGIVIAMNTYPDIWKISPEKVSLNHNNGDEKIEKKAHRHKESKVWDIPKEND